MVKASCNVLWEVYIGVSGQGGAPIGPSPLWKINQSPTAEAWLIKVKEVVLWKTGVQLVVDCALQGFREDQFAVFLKNY